RAVLDTRSGGKRRYGTLAARAMRAARRFDPDVVYAHFLVPAGLLAGLASRAPLVLTAHGRDVRNVGAIPGIRSLTRLTVRRATGRSGAGSKGGQASSSCRPPRTARSRRESPQPVWSASRASSSPSARPCSRRWHAAGRWSRRASAGRLSSSRRRRAFSSIRSTWRPSRKRSWPRPSSRARTTAHAPPRSVTMSPSKLAASKRCWSEQRARPQVRYSLAGPMPEKIRVLIADDHRLFAQALEAFLSNDSRIAIVGKASDGEEAIKLARTRRPDVVLMDIAMPKVDGVEATRQIRS